MIHIMRIVAITVVVFSGLHLAAHGDDLVEFDAVKEIPIEKFYRLRADREITLREFAWLCEKCDILISHHRHLEETGNERVNHISKRQDAASQLGYFGHKYALPGLLAVLRDEAEEPDVRRVALGGLSKIADPRAVEILIDSLSIPDVAAGAAENLMGMTGVLIGYRLGGGLPRTHEQHLALQNEWRAWWKEHADEVEIQRVGSTAPAHFAVPVDKWKPTRPRVKPQELEDALPQ